MTKPHPGPSDNFVNRVVQSAVGRLLTIVGFVSFVIVALYPFAWDLPSMVDNGASVNGDGNVEFRTPGILKELQPPLWLQSAKDSGSASIELTVRPFTVRPGEPDRILTLSRDHIIQSLMVGQDGDALVLRLIGRGNDRGVRWSAWVKDVFAANEWRRIEIDIDTGRLQVRVNDNEVLDVTIPEQNSPRNWNSSHLLALGNEHMGRRPWLGEIAAARIKVGGENYEILKSTTMQMPQKFWSARYSPRLDSIIRFESERHYWSDYFANFICFVPIGFLLAARRKRGRPLLYATVICTAASLGVELSQIFFVRDPSLYDWIFNTGGGAAGAALACLLRQRA